MRHGYIVIEGAIGVGKTTLARMLKEHLQTNLVLEVFEENPFLAKFYESRARYAFQTQMFFLLSRYRQQQRQIPHLHSQGALISDYMFAKDWLFAKLNLSGDEWEVYEQIHTALAEQTPQPDLIVYLQASTDVLMARIAQRDRPYERDMDRNYIDTLRQVYEHYFAEIRSIPILNINTNNLNFVANQDDFRTISGQIQSFLQNGIFQQELIDSEEIKPEKSESITHKGLADFQEFHVRLDESKGFNANVYFNYLRLSEEVGELGSELARMWTCENAYRAQGLKKKKARRKAIRGCLSEIESELADCMAYILKLANYTGIDLEAAYLEKMSFNETRTWKHIQNQ